MGAEKAQPLRREILRALTHAQGQLVRSHKIIMLFLALDTLDHIKQSLPGLETNCAGACATESELAVYRDNPEKCGGMFTWELNAALGNTAAALKEMATYCKSRTVMGSRGSKGTYRQAWMLGESLMAYMEMALDIQDPEKEIEEPFQRAAKINPYTSAAFIAEYMIVIASRFELMTKTSDGAVYERFATKLREEASKIRNNIPGDEKAIYEITRQDHNNLGHIMDLMGSAAGLAHTFRRATGELGDLDDRLSRALDCLFQTAVLYDWQQYKGGGAANKNNRDEQSATILKFSPK